MNIIIWIYLCVWKVRCVLFIIRCSDRRRLFNCVLQQLHKYNITCVVWKKRFSLHDVCFVPVDKTCNCDLMLNWSFIGDPSQIHNTLFNIQHLWILPWKLIYYRNNFNIFSFNIVYFRENGRWVPTSSQKSVNSLFWNKNGFTMFSMFCEERANNLLVLSSSSVLWIKV